MAVSLGSKELTFTVAGVQDSQVDRGVEVSNHAHQLVEAPGQKAGRPIVEAQAVEEHPGAHHGGKNFVVEDEENITSVGEQPWQRGDPPSRDMMA